MKTILDYIQWASQKFEKANLFFGHGTDSAWDEAVQLVLQATNLPINSDQSVGATEVSVFQKKKIIDWVEKRIKTRQPLPYITHTAWFMELPFYVDERVLIPRSPFAELIQQKFRPWIQSDTPRVLEIGTGSGCMAIACALVFPQAMIDAVDISEDALGVARINSTRYEMDQQINWIESDCFTALDGKRYDLIISNPPYVSAQEMAELPDEYLHEPRMALEASEHGLAVAAQIIEQAKQHLNPKGTLVIEVGNNDEALLARFPRLPWVTLEFEHGGQGVFLINREEL